MDTNAPVTLRGSLSPIHVCALALGCIVGWTGFHEPGAAYLREAGPGGTLLAIGVAALVGRGALGWFVDLCSLGAAVGYGYTSAAALRLARREGRRPIVATGAAGVALSVLFAALLLVPIPALDCAMKPHTWACLVVWLALGALFRLAAGRRHHRGGTA